MNKKLVSLYSQPESDTDRIPEDELIAALAAAFQVPAELIGQTVTISALEAAREMEIQAEMMSTVVRAFQQLQAALPTEDYDGRS
jgi:hypothetical protein